MDENSAWFTSSDQLIDRIREARAHWGQVPAIPGYDRIVEYCRGGQGVIYKARQCATGDTVIVKVLIDGMFATEACKTRFQREIQSIRQVRHPAMVRILDHGTSCDGRLYYAMEFIDGVPVDASHLPSGDSIEDKLALFSRICDAIRHAHQFGIIHRDLKPGNILVDKNGDPRILDFGLVKFSNHEQENLESTSTLSRTGQFLGSLAWASPEQIEDRPEAVDVRTDIYSLGVILYQMITGRLPHPVRNNLRQTLNEITTETPERPRSIDHRIPLDLETVTLRCLAKDRDRRYQTVLDLQRDIDHLLNHEPIEAKRDDTWYVIKKTIRRHRAITGLAASLALLAVVFTAAITVSYQQARHNLDLAVAQQAKSEEIKNYLASVLALSDPCSWSELSTPAKKMLDSAAMNIGGRFRDHPEVEAEVRGILGEAYHHLGFVEESVSNFEQAIDRFGSIGKSDHPDCAAIMAKLADQLIHDRRLDHARELLDEAYEIYEANFPKNHVRMADLYRYEADLLAEQRRFDRAETLFAEAQSIYEANIALHDRRMLKTLYHWSNLLIAARRFDEAERKLARLERIHNAHLEENAWVSCVVPYNRGRIMLRSENAEASRDHFAKGLECAETVFGPTHMLPSELHGYMGHAWYIEGRYEEAEACYRKALGIRRELQGEVHISVASSLHHVAYACWMLGDLDEADSLLGTAIDVLGKISVPEHTFHAELLMRHGQLAGDKNEWERAASLYEDAVDVLDGAGISEGPQRARILGRLGASNTECGRFDEAEERLLAALALLPDSEPESYAREILTSILNLYEKWGRKDECTAYLSRLDAMTK